MTIVVDNQILVIVYSLMNMSSPLSSVFHLFLSTAPFLVLFFYFIYLALVRPRVLEKQYENDDLEQNPPMLIPLKTMLDTFLFTLVLWSHLAVYLIYVVPRRRKLMESYTSEENGVTTVIGDVF